MENKLVLDFGGTAVKYALMDVERNFLEKGSQKAPTDSMDLLLQTIDGLTERFRNRFNGVAISLAGQIDREKGYVYRGGAYRFLENIPLASVLSQRYHVPVTILNDANAATLAEAQLGNLRNISNGMAIIIGTGIGAGLILNGNIVPGSNFYAGELSGIVTDRHDKTMYGTFCATNGTRTLLREYGTAVGVPPETLDGRRFFEKVSADKNAYIVLNRFCENLALQIYNIQCLLDLQRIVLGGGISQQSALIAGVQDQLDMVFERYARFHVQKPQVLACKFFNDANLFGALLNYETSVQN